MIVETVPEESVLAALGLAGRAPSVHNSQPWRWWFEPGSVHLYIDPRRWLPATDPDARDLLISCGCALHHLTVGLVAADIHPVIHRLPNPADPDHLAAVELTPAGSGPAAVEVALSAAIARRRTDRRRFGDWPLPAGYLDALAAGAARYGAVLRAVTGEGPRATLVSAIEQAAAEQAADPAYPTEIAYWSGLRAGVDGVRAASAPAPGDDAAVVPMRRWADGELSQPETGADGATLLVLGTSSDDRLSQLRAGEAASLVLLLATELGLASSVLSQPLEVPAARRVVRDDVLGGTLCPQLIIRVGWPPAGAPSVPATPRRPLSEVFQRAAR
jgi:hypothetical protein